MIPRKFKRINMHRLAVAVTLAEGGKVNLSIAQVKEVLGIAFGALNTHYSKAQVMDLIENAQPVLLVGKLD